MPHTARFMLATCSLLTALAGCGVTPGNEAAATGRAQTAGSLSVSGALSHAGTIALPQDAFAIIELRDTEPPRAVIAAQRIELQGQSLPVRFELVVDRAELASDRTYAVRGAVKKGGNALWARDPMVIGTTSVTTVDLGMQHMSPVIVVAFGSDWNCRGHHPLEVGTACRPHDPRQGIAGVRVRFKLGMSHWRLHR
jgi:uncharacterized lipoprotein YbaY